LLFIQKFEEANYSVTFIPVLEFKFVNGEDLSHAIKNGQKYSGLIVTSPRAMEALNIVISLKKKDEDFSKACDLWTIKPVFVVGKKTLQHSPLQFCKTTEGTGGAVKLTEMLINNKKDFDSEKPLLFLCGNKRRNELPSALSKEKILFEELIVYDTVPKSFTTGDTPTELSKKPKWVAFFSPSGVHSILSRFSLESGFWQGIRKIALGPTTAQALRNGNLGVDVVANKPCADSLLEGIRLFDQKELQA